jgi:hypothetical protein
MTLPPGWIIVECVGGPHDGLKEQWDPNSIAGATIGAVRFLRKDPYTTMDDAIAIDLSTRSERYVLHDNPLRWVYEPSSRP